MNKLDYDEYETMWNAYQNARGVVAAFERMFELETENEKLKDKLKEHEDRVDRMFKGQQEQIGKTLSALIK